MENEPEIQGHSNFIKAARCAKKKVSFGKAQCQAIGGTDKSVNILNNNKQIVA